MPNESSKRRPADDFLNITDFWHLCLSHWNWFLVSVIAFIGVAFYYISTTSPLYMCEAALMVKQESQAGTAAKNTSGENFDNLTLVQQSNNVVNVQRELTSLRVLTEVARRMEPRATEAEVDQLAGQIRSRLKAKLTDEKSTIINLEYHDLSPRKAKEVLATVIQVYNEMWLDDKSQVALSASRFIEERLAVIERELGSVDDSISTFKARHKITDLGRVSDVYLNQQTESDAEILRLNNQKSMAQYILGILQDKAAHHQLLPTNSGINNSVAESQIAQYNTMLFQLKNSMYGTSRQNPLIIKQEAALDDLRGNILATISNHIKTLDIQLRALQGYSGEAGQRISSSPDQAKHLVSVEREQKVKESLYLYLLQKKEENQIGMTYTSLNTQVLDMPHGSEQPTSPNKRNVYSGALLLALLLPAVILFVRESIDNTVRDKYDIERRTSLSLIGEIPQYASPKQRALQWKPWLWRRRRQSDMFAVQSGSQNFVNEAFRLLRTNLEFMTSGPGDKNVYIVTSSYEGSGKTFVSMNLSMALAIKGQRVLFIDGDMRHASASHHLKCSEAGLADYLGEKQTDLDTLIVPYSEYPNLHILPVGTIPPNPTELLATDRLSRLLDEVRGRYDFIFIDCPPAETLADTGIIERFADRTLFVIRAGLFVRARLYDLEADVQGGKYKHLSLVLNGIKSGGRYGYRYGYHYGYHYGHYYGRS